MTYVTENKRKFKNINARCRRNCDKFVKMFLNKNI